MAHPAAVKASSKSKTPPAGAKKKIEQTFTLKKNRDEWVKGAYERGKPEYLARTARSQ
jgi:hypothetical protein